jgi:hypothetical protein
MNWSQTLLATLLVKCMGASLVIGAGFQINGLTLPIGTTYHEGGGGSSVIRDEIRLQEIYEAELFPPHPILIRELRWRPSAVYGGSFTAKLDRMQINLSTTRRRSETLSRTFAANVGDDDTVVFDGPITLKSEFAGPTMGPKEFDIIVPFMVPFNFNPRAGNLLVEIRNHRASLGTYVDAGNGNHVARSFNLGATSTMGTVGDGGSDCIQFCYTHSDHSEPPRAGLLLNGSFEYGVHPGIRVNLSAIDETSLPGWKITHGTIDYTGERWRAADGGRCVSFRSIGGTVISQQLSDLQMGHWYRLSFAIAMNPEARSRCADLVVSVGNASNRFSATTLGERGDLKWRAALFEFEATGREMTLSLVCDGDEGFGPVIDSLTLTHLQRPGKAALPKKVYDIAIDFKTNANPAGAWRYGWKETFDGTLTLLTAKKVSNPENGISYQGWQLASVGEPSIHKLVGSVGADEYRQSGAVVLSPGPKSSIERFGVARFTVPVGSAGNYRIEVSAKSSIEGTVRGGIDFHVLLNNSEIYGRLITAGVTIGEFVRDLELNDGDTIDFMVGGQRDDNDQRLLLALGARLTQSFVPSENP